MEAKCNVASLKCTCSQSVLDGNRAQLARWAVAACPQIAAPVDKKHCCLVGKHCLFVMSVNRIIFYSSCWRFESYLQFWSEITRSPLGSGQIHRVMKQLSQLYRLVWFWFSRCSTTLVRICLDHVTRQIRHFYRCQRVRKFENKSHDVTRSIVRSPSLFHSWRLPIAKHVNIFLHHYVLQKSWSRVVKTKLCFYSPWQASPRYLKICVSTIVYHLG